MYDEIAAAGNLVEPEIAPELEVEVEWDEMQGPDATYECTSVDSKVSELFAAASELQQDLEERIDGCEVIPWELRMDVWGSLMSFDPQSDGPKQLRSLGGRLQADACGDHPDVQEITSRLERLVDIVVRIH